MTRFQVELRATIESGGSYKVTTFKDVSSISVRGFVAILYCDRCGGMPVAVVHLAPGEWLQQSAEV